MRRVVGKSTSAVRYGIKSTYYSNVATLQVFWDESHTADGVRSEVNILMTAEAGKEVNT
jgi:hypothetical protein